jgi:AraC-like DNA-binding protein
MLIKDFLPDPSHADFVQCYRIVHFEFGKFDEIPLKAYPPKPEQVLHFFVRDGIEVMSGCERKSQYPVLIAGQQTSVVNRYTGKDFLNLQIVFQPTGLFRLTGIPANELTNKYIDATCIFTGNILFTYERLQYAKSYSEMLQIAESFVTEQIELAREEFHPLDKLSRLLLQNKAGLSLDMMAKQSYLSTRQFIRRFNQRTGVNPKSYARIVRFTKAFNLKNKFPKMDWLRVSLECGYYDYQHLIKDYRDFTKMKPNDFHFLESRSPERTLGLTKELYHSRV